MADEKTVADETSVFQSVTGQADAPVPVQAETPLLPGSEPVGLSLPQGQTLTPGQTPGQESTPPNANPNNMPPVENAGVSPAPSVGSVVPAPGASVSPAAPQQPINNNAPINMTDQPIVLSPAQATQTLSTDAENARRGAAKEGQPLLTPPVQAGLVPRRWGVDTGEAAPDNTFYAKSFVPDDADSVIPKDAPVGWVRDTDGHLWDAGSIGGLTVEAEGAGRYFVRAYSPHGLKTLSIHTADRARAEAHLEHIALHLSEAKGLIEFIDGEEAQGGSQEENQTKGNAAAKAQDNQEGKDEGEGANGASDTSRRRKSNQDSK